MNPQTREHRVAIGLMLLEFYYILSIAIAYLPIAHRQQIATVALLAGSFLAASWTLKGLRERANYYLDPLGPGVKKSIDWALLGGIGLQLLSMFVKGMPVIGLVMCVVGFVVVAADAIAMMLPLGRRINPEFLPDSEAPE